MFSKPAELLLECERKLRSAAEPQPKAGFFARLLGKAPRPIFEDESGDHLAQHMQLARTGRVVWAALVMANTVLFKVGKHDAPAAVLFSFDPYYANRPDELSILATDLDTIRHSPDGGSVPGLTAAESSQLRTMLQDERNRTIDRTLPPALTGGRTVRYESIGVRRSRLPESCLIEGLFPVVVDPAQPTELMLPPLACWPDEVVRHWRAEHRLNPRGTAMVKDLVTPTSDAQWAANPITLSAAAAQAVKKIMADQGLAAITLVVGAESDGGGFHYTFDMKDDPHWNAAAGTHLFHVSHGIRLATERAAATLMLGTVIDWKVSAEGEGFEFKNPNAK